MDLREIPAWKLLGSTTQASKDRPGDARSVLRRWRGQSGGWLAWPRGTPGGGAFRGEDDRLPSGHTHVVASLGSQVKKSSKQTLRAGTQGEGGSGPGEVGNVI